MSALSLGAFRNDVCRYVPGKDLKITLIGVVFIDLPALD